MPGPETEADLIGAGVRAFENDNRNAASKPSGLLAPFAREPSPKGKGKGVAVGAAGLALALSAAWLFWPGSSELAQKAEQQSDILAPTPGSGAVLPA